MAQLKYMQVEKLSLYWEKFQPSVGRNGEDYPQLDIEQLSKNQNKNPTDNIL